MRVLHVLTYVSPNMDFGGPVRVAVNLGAELRRRGHEVVIAAGARGYSGKPPQTIDDVPAVVGPVHQIIPRAGVNGLASPALSSRIAAEVDSADIVHVHFVRDLVAMPAALAAVRKRKPFVLQCHGMIDSSDRLLARPLDAVLTRPLLNRAAAVFYLTDRERTDIEQVAGRRLARAHRLPNGIPPVQTPPTAVPEADDRLVLFAARVHPQKRPEVFVDAAALIANDIPDAHFVIVGPDGGSLGLVRERIRVLGLDDRVHYAGPASRSDIMTWFRRSAVYVLPSVYEPFGMTALEAMSVGTPVVVTTSCGLARDVAETGAGAAVASDPESIAAAVSQLLRDPSARSAAGAAGRAVASGRYGIAAVVDRLEYFYDEAMKG